MPSVQNGNSLHRRHFCKIRFIFDRNRKNLSFSLRSKALPVYTAHQPETLPWSALSALCAAGSPESGRLRPRRSSFSDMGSPVSFPDQCGPCGSKTHRHPAGDVFKTTVGEVAADRADNGTDRNGDDHAKDTPEAAADQNRDDDKEAGHAGRLAENFRS